MTVSSIRLGADIGSTLTSALIERSGAMTMPIATEDVCDMIEMRPKADLSTVIFALICRNHRCPDSTASL